jgi:TspO/MBR family
MAHPQVFHVTGFDWQSRALKLYASQLALNFLWPIVRSAPLHVPCTFMLHLLRTPNNALRRFVGWCADLKPATVQTFFNWRKLALSCLVNLALLTTAVATTGAFYKIRTEAGQLMLPYVVWWVLIDLTVSAACGAAIRCKQVTCWESSCLTMHCLCSGGRLAFANLLNIAVWRKNPNANKLEPARQQKPIEGDEYGPTGPAGRPVGGWAPCWRRIVMGCTANLPLRQYQPWSSARLNSSSVVSSTSALPRC